MDELKLIKSMFNDGKISRKEAKQLLKTVLSSEINDKYYKNTIKEESIKIKIIAEESENKKVDVDINISFKFLNLLNELKTDEDNDIDFTFNDKNFKVDVGDIINLTNKLKNEGKQSDFIEITEENGTKVKIYVYLI